MSKISPNDTPGMIAAKWRNGLLPHLTVTGLCDAIVQAEVRRSREDRKAKRRAIANQRPRLRLVGA